MARSDPSDDDDTGVEEALIALPAAEALGAMAPAEFAALGALGGELAAPAAALGALGAAAGEVLPETLGAALAASEPATGALRLAEAFGPLAAFAKEWGPLVGLGSTVAQMGMGPRRPGIATPFAPDWNQALQAQLLALRRRGLPSREELAERTGSMVNPEYYRQLYG